MTSIVKYQKVIADGTTYLLAEPDYSDGDARCTELCTIDGETYVAVPDTVTLPEQPAKITVEKVALTDALRDQIKAASPHVRLINRRVVDKIREKYTQDDEFKLGWMDPADPKVAAFREYVTACVAEGQAEKVALGLG